MTSPNDGVTIALSRDTELVLASILGDVHFVSDPRLATKILLQLRQGNVLTISLAEHRQLRDLLDSYLQLHSYLQEARKRYEFKPEDRAAILTEFDMGST